LQHDRHGDAERGADGGEPAPAGRGRRVYADERGQRRDGDRGGYGLDRSKQRRQRDHGGYGGRHGGHHDDGRDQDRERRPDHAGGSDLGRQYGRDGDRAVGHGLREQRGR